MSRQRRPRYNHDLDQRRHHCHMRLEVPTAQRHTAKASETQRSSLVYFSSSIPQSLRTSAGHCEEAFNIDFATPKRSRAWCIKQKGIYDGLAARTESVLCLLGCGRPALRVPTRVPYAEYAAIFVRYPEYSQSIQIAIDGMKC